MDYSNIGHAAQTVNMKCYNQYRTTASKRSIAASTPDVYTTLELTIGIMTYIFMCCQKPNPALYVILGTWVLLFL